MHYQTLLAGFGYRVKIWYILISSATASPRDLCMCVWPILHRVRVIHYRCSSLSLSVSHHDESLPPSNLNAT